MKNNSDNNFYQRNLSFKNKAFSIYEELSVFEKTMVFIFGILGSVFLIISLLMIFSNFLQVSVPTQGGTIEEGIIGNPRFINPVLASSQADRDLTSLIFSGLMRRTPDGNFIPDLAESFEINAEKTQYKFILRDNLEFHNGDKLTTEDIKFTIDKVTDPELQSPKLPNWQDITVNIIDERTIIFELEKPYEPFLENTTLGILPQDLWQEINNDQFPLNNFNLNAIGSGPYKISEIEKNDLDIATKYTLEPFKNFSLGQANISKIIFSIFNNQEELITAFKEHRINSIQGINPESAEELENSNSEINSYDLPRVFGLFLNQNNANLFANIEVRNVLNQTVPREEIVNEVFKGYAKATASPVPGNILDKQDKLEETAVDSDNTNIDLISVEEAQTILEEAGWEKNENGIYNSEIDGERKLLSFSISTVDNPELIQVANKLISKWNEIGIDVQLLTYPRGEFNQNILRPREFESSLFGMIVNKEVDLYAFWHSSQRNDPGLNISSYTNLTVDSILSNIRQSEDQENINEQIIDFEKEIQEDIPAIFIYSPKYIYILPENIKGVEINNLTTADDRFLNIYKWYINTDRVLKIFK